MTNAELCIEKTRLFDEARALRFRAQRIAWLRSISAVYKEGLHARGSTLEAIARSLMPSPNA